MGLWGPVGLDLDNVILKTRKRASEDHRVPMRQVEVHKIEVFTPRDLDYYGDVQVKCPNTEDGKHRDPLSNLVPWSKLPRPQRKVVQGRLVFRCPMCGHKWTPPQMYCLLIDVAYDAPARALYGITIQGKPHLFAN